MVNEQKNPLKDADELFGLDNNTNPLDVKIAEEELDFSYDYEEIAEGITNKNLITAAHSKGISKTGLCKIILKKEKDCLENNDYNALNFIYEQCGLFPKILVKKKINDCLKKNDLRSIRDLRDELYKISSNNFGIVINELYSETSDFRRVKDLFITTNVRPNKLDWFFDNYLANPDKEKLEFVVDSMGLNPSQNVFNNMCRYYFQTNDINGLETLLRIVRKDPSEDVRDEGYDLFLSRDDVGSVYKLYNIYKGNVNRAKEYFPSEELTVKYYQKFVGEGKLDLFYELKKLTGYAYKDKINNEFLTFLSK